MDSVSKEELITVEAEVALVKQFQEGGADAQSAIDKLLLCNRRFVTVTARKYVDQSHSLSDLIAEGNKGIVVAAQRYDPSRGFKFSSYAIWFIRKSIENAIFESQSEVRQHFELHNITK